MNHQHEAYGSVDSKSLRRRKKAVPSKERQQQQQQNQQQLQKRSKSKAIKPKAKEAHAHRYRYNKQISLLTIPCFISLFFLHPNNLYGDNDDANSSNNNVLLLITFLYCSLWIYILDLANRKDGFRVSIWLSFTIILFFLFWEWCTTSRQSDAHFFGSITMSNYYIEDDDRDWMVMMYWKIKLESWCIFLFSIWNLVAKIMFFFSLACWTTLQCQCLEPIEAKSWEELLHFNLPISFSTIMSFTLLQLYQPHNYYYYNEHDEINNYHEWKEINFVWTIIPFIFTFCFSWSIKLLCNLQSSFPSDSFERNNNDNRGYNYRQRHSQHDLENTFDGNDRRQQQRRIQQEQEDDQRRLDSYYTIPSLLGSLLSYMLLGIPFAIYVVSYLIQQNNCQFMTMMTMKTAMSSSSMSTVQFASVSWAAIMSDLVVIILVPYLIHCYHLDHGLWWKGELLSIINNQDTMNGNYRSDNNHSIRSITIGRTTLHMRSIMAFIAVTEVIIHQYLIQICLIVAHHIHHDDQSVVLHSKPMISILLNCCIGILGTSFWWMNRRRRDQNMVYDAEENIDKRLVLMILMSSLCVGGALSLPWLVIFCVTAFVVVFGLYIPTRTLPYILSSLVLLVSISSIFSKWFKIIDKSVWIIPGLMKLSILQFHIIFSSGSFSCGIIYALLRRHTTNNRFSIMLEEIDALGIILVIYTIFLSLMEGVLLYEPLDFWGESLYSNSLVTISSLLLMGIAFSLKYQKAIKDATYLFSLSVSIGKAVASTIENEMHGNFITSSMITALFVFVIAMPFMLATPIHLNRMESSLAIPRRASKLITVFSSIILPITIIVSMPVLESFISILMYGGTIWSYYSHSLLASEVMGYSMILWGISVWSLLYHHFPRGGAEAWRNAALFSFTCGLLICFISLTYPVLDRYDNVPSFIFAAVSSTDSIVRRHEEKGLWGLIAISVAILLAFFGPLNLCKTNTFRTRYGLSFARRLVILSVLFGGGLSWYLVFQLMGNFTKFQTVIIVTSSMLNSITYTVAAVYHVDERHFSERKTMKMGKITVSVGFISTFIAVMILAISTDAIGRSISILLSLWALYSFVLGISLRLRPKNNKNTKTRALANLCFVYSWLFLTAVVYGCFGVASIGVSTNFNSILGYPASTVFTLPLASILLLVEGDPKRRRNWKISCFEISLSHLSDQQRYFLPVIAAGATFVLASLHVILFRGCCNQWLIKGSHDTYEAIFQSNYGRSSRTTYHSNIAELAKKQLSHHTTVAITSKLAASGFWTSTSATGPVIHLLGLISVLPTWCSLSSFLLPSSSEITHSTLLICLPFSLFPLFVAGGIQSLNNAAFLGSGIAIYKSFTQRRKNWRGRITT